MFQASDIDSGRFRLRASSMLLKLFGVCGLALAALFASTAMASASVVNDDTTGPGPAGANCAAATFTNIQDAVDAAAPGDTIQVCAGSYADGATITKQLSLVGAQAGVDARNRAVPVGSESTITGSGINVGADGVSIDGFRFSDVGDGAPAFGPALLLASGTGNSRVLNSVFRSNVFGMYLTNDSPGDTVVRHDLFDSNNDSGPAGGNGIYGDFGINGAQIDANKFTGNENGAMVLTETAGRNSDISITGNEVTNDQGITVVLTDGLTIANNTITNVSTPVSGGPFSAIHLAGSVNGATISGNTVSGASSAVRVTNSFDPAPNQGVVVTGNNLLDNTDPSVGYGIRVDSGGYSGLFQAHFNRIVGNGAAGLRNDDALVDASNNWWGCNAGPGQVGCDSVSGAAAAQVESNPWLVLGLAAAPTTVLQNTGQSQLTANLTGNSAGNVAGSGFPDNVPIAFTASPLGSVSPPSNVTDGGAAKSLFSAGATTGAANASARLDAQTVTVPLTIVTGQQGVAGAVSSKCNKHKKHKKHPHPPTGKKKKCKRHKHKKH